MVVYVPDQTDGLTGSSNPTNQAREEETEAESDDGVAPEHVAVEEPVDGDGGGEDPGHVPDQDAADHLKEEIVKQAVTSPDVCQFKLGASHVFVRTKIISCSLPKTEFHKGTSTW